MQAEARAVAISQHEGLGLAIALPHIRELEGVPVDLEEQMREVVPPLRTVLLPVALPRVARELHVRREGVQPRARVVAGRHVDVHAQRRRHAVAVRHGEAGPGALVVRVLHPGARPVAVGRVARGVRVLRRARELHRLDRAPARV